MTPFRILTSILIASSALFLASCAGGLSYAETKSNLPKIQNGKGRIFVYRPSSVGFGVKPKVKINGNIVGVSEGQGFLFSDQLPGKHVVSTSTEWKHNTTVDVIEGQPSFVKCSVYPGLLVAHIAPKVVDRATGEAGIQKCKLKK